MFSRTITVTNKTGLHARPATEFVTKAKSFASKVSVKRAESADAPVNAKSIIRLLSAGIAQGSTIEIIAEGPDEAEAVNALVELIETGFGEE